MDEGVKASVLMLTKKEVFFVYKRIVSLITILVIGMSSINISYNSIKEIGMRTENDNGLIFDSLNAIFINNEYCI